MKNGYMSLWDHLHELRKRLILSSICVIVFGIICYIYWSFLLGILLKPAGGRELVYLNVMEPFVARFKLAMWGGFLLGFPFVLYQILAFVAPGLTKKEKRFFIIISFFLMILFYGGVYFGYKYVVGIGIKWLEAQGAGIVKSNLTVSEYISFIGLFLLAFGLAFETPLVVVFLTHFGLVSPVALIKQWRIATVIILLFAAIITPDWSPVTMGLMAAPIMGLYILGIALSFIFAPRKKKIKERAAATS